MLIVCPNCATSYRVETSSLGAAGRSVRCVRCRNVWFAHDPAALTAIAQAYRTEVDALVTSASVDVSAPPAPEAPMAPPEVAAADDPSPPEHPIDTEQAPSEMPADAPIAETPPPLAAESPDQDSLPQAPEPIVIADAPALAPMEPGATLPVDATLGEDIETFAARRAPRARRRARWPLPGLPMAILALIVLDAALIGWRADTVRVAPQTASLYAAIGLPVNLRGLTFANVTTATETHDGVQVLVVEGTIASASARVVEVPRLRISVRDGGGQEVYAWTALPARSILAPGETLAFGSRLASPPPDARDVLVRFFNRRDLVAGIP